MSDITTIWNALDSIIYKIESGIIRLSGAIKEGKTEIPDPEEMILAATEQLQIENKQLKQKEYPGILKNINGHYYCPNCKELIPHKLIEQQKKYCPECGKRIIMPIPYKNSEFQ